jgi:hypothetical protein
LDAQCQRLILIDFGQFKIGIFALQPEPLAMLVVAAGFHSLALNVANVASKKLNLASITAR